MKEEAWIGKKGARYWYYRYRDSEYYSLVIIGLTIVVGLFLLFGIIIPQLNEWFSIRKQVVEANQRIEVLQANINFTNNLDRARLANQLTIASTALPSEKNFGNMLNVLSSAAIKANVSLSDYSFQVGDVASSSAALSTVKVPGLSYNAITVVVVGPLSSVERFIGALEESSPLSEVVAIDGSAQNISVTVQFYQKPYPTISIPDTQRLTTLPGEKLQLLQKLSGWSLPEAPTAKPANVDVPLF